jgi:hypothetical protein
MTQPIRLSEIQAGLIEVQFTSVLASNLQSRISAATLANTAITVYSKRGGVGPAVALTSDGTTWTAADDTHALGVRGYVPKASEIVLGVQTLIFTGTNMEQREVPIMVVNEDPYKPAYYGAAVAGTLMTSAFTSDRTEATTDSFKNALIEFLEGPAVGSPQPVGAYDGAAKKFTLKTGYTFPAAPVAGNKFRIITC